MPRAVGTKLILNLLLCESINPAATKADPKLIDNQIDVVPTAGENGIRNSQGDAKGRSPLKQRASSDPRVRPLSKRIAMRSLQADSATFGLSITTNTQQQCLASIRQRIRWLNLPGDLRKI